MWGNSLQTWQHVVSRLWIIHRALVAWEFSEVPCFRLRALLRASLRKPGRKVTFTTETQINSSAQLPSNSLFVYLGLSAGCTVHGDHRRGRPTELPAEASDLLLSHILVKPLSSTLSTLFFFFFFKHPEPNRLWVFASGNPSPTCPTHKAENRSGETEALEVQ